VLLIWSLSVLSEALSSERELTARFALGGLPKEARMVRVQLA
jgi:hypothetical protein